MPRLLVLLLVSLILALVPIACGGGSSGGGGGGGGDPPPAPFSETVSTGLAIADFATAATMPPFVVAPVSEPDMNADRNGDGDPFDHVVARINTETGHVTNLGLAVVGPVLASDRHFAFLVSEAGNGSTDFNGDGDAVDAVWFVYDPTKPFDINNPRNTGVATPPLGLPGAATKGGFLFLHSEIAAGVDFNGDLDTNDNIIRVFDGDLGVIIPLLTRAHAFNTPLVAHNGRVLVVADEIFDGADHNRDGDAFDFVLYYVDFGPAAAALRPVGGIFPRAVGLLPFALTDNAAVFFIDETSEGNSDLNQDGDSTDAILAVMDLQGFSAAVQPFSPIFPGLSLGVAATTSIGIGVGDERAVIAVDERGSNNVDLNGDIDRFDSVFGWVDTRNAPSVIHILPLAMAQLPPFVSGDRALVAAHEFSTGAIVGTDLNGDGDTDDSVAHMVDLRTSPGSITNLQIASARIELVGSDAFISVPESGQFGLDLNGNGSANDIVTVYADFGDSPPSMLSLGIVATATSFFRLSQTETRIAAVMPEGQSPRFGDLNSDGDNNDVGISLFTIDPSLSPPRLIAPTPSFAGTASFFTSPPLRVGDEVFVFATSEAMVNKDLNEDGDKDDTILQYVRYLPTEE